MKYLSLHALFAAAAVTLAACGGGTDDATSDLADDSTESSADEEATAATQSPRDDALTTTSSTITATCGLANFQSEALQRINAYRARGASCGASGTFGATTPLAWNGALNTAASRHANDMKARNFFSHTGSDGSSPGTRITRAGYAWTTYGENIAAGQGTVQAVVDGWMRSPGHCANLMKPTFRDVGLACVKGGTTNTYRTYWTLDLARR